MSRGHGQLERQILAQLDKHPGGMTTNDLVWKLFRVARGQEDSASNYVGPAVWNEERTYSSALSGVGQALARLRRDRAVYRMRDTRQRYRGGPAPFVWYSLTAT